MRYGILAGVVVLVASFPLLGAESAKAENGLCVPDVDDETHCVVECPSIWRPVIYADGVLLAVPIGESGIAADLNTEDRGYFHYEQHVGSFVDDKGEQRENGILYRAIGVAAGADDCGDGGVEDCIDSELDWDPPESMVIPPLPSINSTGIPQWPDMFSSDFSQLVDDVLALCANGT